MHIFSTQFQVYIHCNERFHEGGEGCATESIGVSAGISQAKFISRDRFFRKKKLRIHVNETKEIQHSESSIIK